MSLNLHGMVRGVITAINSDIMATLKRSAGYTVGANGKQVPAYSTVSGMIQPQALTSDNLKHMDALNIQGIRKQVYMYGDWGGPVRADATGGDVLSFPRVKGGPAVDWKIVVEFETWTDSGWCCVGVVLQ